MRAVHRGFVLNAVISIVAANVTAGFAEGTKETGAQQYYFLNASLFSVAPEKGIDGIRTYGSGGVGSNGELDLGVGRDDRHFRVSIKAVSKQRRFLAMVTLTPEEGDDRTKALMQEFDFSDLSPHVLELAKDDDGRAYRLNLHPTVIAIPSPKIFRAADLALERWTFDSSQVILNDQDYLGQLSMGSSPIAWLDIPGVAKVEFSLLALVDGKPEGVLENGTINIVHDTTSLRISNVRNGTNADVLSGPYRVWVRWGLPTQSVEQYRVAWQKQLAKIKKQIEEGDLDLPPGRLVQLERVAHSDRVLQISSGVRGTRSGEIMPDKDIDLLK